MRAHPSAMQIWKDVECMSIIRMWCPLCCRPRGRRKKRRLRGALHLYKHLRQCAKPRVPRWAPYRHQPYQFCPYMLRRTPGGYHALKHTEAMAIVCGVLVKLGVAVPEHLLVRLDRTLEKVAPKKNRRQHAIPGRLMGG